MIRKIISTAVVSVIMGAMAFSAADAAMIIQYSFDDNTAEATTNDLTALGVTAGLIETSNTQGGNTGIANERWQRKLHDQTPTNMLFTISIPSGVTIDLTELNFIDGIDSNQGTNDTFSQWELTINELIRDGSGDVTSRTTIGSANPDSGTRVLDTGATGMTSGSNSVTLTGLEGLTDTEIEFDFLVNYGVTPDFSGGGNNNYRHAFLDDVTLTAIPEPSTALVTGLAALFGLCFYRPRRK